MIPTEISDLALRVLTSPSLAEKMKMVESLSDQRPDPGLTILPNIPARAERIAFNQSGVNFPKDEALIDPQARGWLFHTFANHELLAMELMALCLLKFPHAESAFRMGLAKILLQERDHLDLYLMRMDQLGVVFGDGPISSFFWKAMSSMESPAAFVAAMSLTFEQANLDFSDYYCKLMVKIGDLESAAVLERVYREEIGHVRHGVTWMKHWFPGDLWQTYRSYLRLPLNPRRGRGIGFDAKGRLAAGFDEDWIARVAVASHPRSRPGELYYFYPLCEADTVHGRRGYSPSRGQAIAMADQETLPQFLAGPDDSVMVTVEPNPAHLARIKQAGFVLPEFLVIEAGKNNIERAIAKRRFSSFRPWGWCHRTIAISERLKPVIDQVPIQCSSDFLRTIHAKSFALELRERFLANQQFYPFYECSHVQTNGKICRDFLEVETARKEWAVMNVHELVVKAPFGYGGQNMIRLSDNGSLGAFEQRWIEHRLAKQKLVVIEPWLDRVYDFGVQGFVDDHGGRLLGVSHFLVDAHGRLTGYRLGNKMKGLNQSLRMFHNGSGQVEQNLGCAAREIMSFVGLALSKLGYRGPCGIDCMIFRQDGHLRVRPIVEINTRYSMGHIALALDKRIHSAAVAHWTSIDLVTIQEQGFKSFADYAHTMTMQHPLVTSGRSATLSQGFLALTDPHLAQRQLSTLMIGLPHV